MKKLKRCLLFLSYALLMFILCMLFVGDNLVLRNDESFTLKEAMPFAIWAVVFLMYHIYVSIYLCKEQRVISFQLFCSILDLSFLFYSSTLSYYRFKEWVILWVIGLRFGSLLMTKIRN